MALGTRRLSATPTLRSKSVWTNTQSLPAPQPMSVTFIWMCFSALLVSLHFVQKQTAVGLQDGQPPSKDQDEPQPRRCYASTYPTDIESAVLIKGS